MTCKDGDDAGPGLPLPPLAWRGRGGSGPGCRAVSPPCSGATLLLPQGQLWVASEVWEWEGLSAVPGCAILVPASARCAPLSPSEKPSGDGSWGRPKAPVLCLAPPYPEHHFKAVCGLLCGSQLAAAAARCNAAACLRSESAQQGLNYLSFALFCLAI